MNLKRDPLARVTRVETLIEQLVEGSFARLFGQRLHPREVALHLARAVEDQAHSDPDGQTVAPNVYRLRLNPDDYAALLAATPNLAQVLVATVIELANQLGARLDAPPLVEIEADDNLAPRSLQIETQWRALDARSTQVLDAVSPPLSEAPAAPRHPQLIVHGTVHIALDRPVMNVGRRHTNHIVIDDARVSRVHSQLRLRFGRYVLYDLGSTGGTFVNNQRINEWILRHGDVISLAGATMVYVEDESSSAIPITSTDTQVQAAFNAAAPRADSDPTRQPPS